MHPTVSSKLFRRPAARDLAPVLEEVGLDVAEALSTWPEPTLRHRPPQIRRFGADHRGRLTRTSGRNLTSRLSRPAGPTEGRLVYAIGDVHGRYDLLIDLLSHLAQDAAEVAEGRTASLILLGDYVDRGPDSARVLEALCRLQAHATFDLCLLKGNHEDALLGFIAAPMQGAAWLDFGGDATLRSYGVEPPEPTAAGRSLLIARDALLRRMPAAHLRLLQNLDLMTVIGDYAFAHAGVAPGEPLRKQTARDLMWVRREFLEARGPFEKIIVHGHTWDSDEPQVTSTRIGLDTGAYETGVLGAMRFDDQDRAWIPIRDAGRPHWRKPGEPAPWTPVPQPLDFTGRAPQPQWGPVLAADVARTG